jgi:hypothetical protein
MRCLQNNGKKTTDKENKMASSSADSARIAAIKKAEAKITLGMMKKRAANGNSGRGAPTPADRARSTELNPSPRMAALIKAEAKITAAKAANARKGVMTPAMAAAKVKAAAKEKAEIEKIRAKAIAKIVSDNKKTTAEKAKAKKAAEKAAAKAKAAAIANAQKGAGMGRGSGKGSAFAGSSSTKVGITYTK